MSEANSRRTGGPASTVQVVQSLVCWAEGLLREAGIERPRFEAQVLLAHVLSTTRGGLVAGLYRPPSPEDVRHFRQMVRQRAARVPMAYLRGSQEFYGLIFRVSPATLIPRPETELLVELTLQHLNRMENGLLVDVGTGSGCIAIACAVHAPRTCVLACDISCEALRVAAENCKAHRVEDRVKLVAGDGLSMVASGIADAVVSNPPYIPCGEVDQLQPEVARYEPRLALDGGPDGLLLHRRLLSDARRVLRVGGMLALETAMSQAGKVASLMEEAAFQCIEVHRDLAGIERAVCGICTG